jgi:hypothetical protein
MSVVVQCWRRRPNPRCARASAYVSREPLAGGMRRDRDALGPRDRDRRAHRPTADRSPAFAGACWSDRVREAAPGQSCRHHGSSRRRRRTAATTGSSSQAAWPTQSHRVEWSHPSPLPPTDSTSSSSAAFCVRLHFCRRVLNSTPRHILLLEPSRRTPTGADNSVVARLHAIRCRPYAYKESADGCGSSSPDAPDADRGQRAAVQKHSAARRQCFRAVETV